MKHHYGFPNAEYCADFVAIARRTLRAGSLSYRLFDLHFLQGRDWKLCTAELGINRGAFFHEVYRVEEALGRAYCETKPFGLWPLDEYFGGTTRDRSSRAAGSTGTSRG